MTLLALSSLGDFAILIGAAVTIWLVAALLVADYGHGKGFAFWPLFIAALFLGFPLVLLGVTLASGGNLTPAKPQRWEAEASE